MIKPLTAMLGALALLWFVAMPFSSKLRPPPPAQVQPEPAPAPRAARAPLPAKQYSLRRVVPGGMVLD